jgi:hypothetical protein
MMDKRLVKKDLVEEILDLLKHEGLSYALVDEARVELAKVTELPPDRTVYPAAKTPQDALEVMDVLEEFLKYVEAFGA